MAIFKRFSSKNNKSKHDQAIANGTSLSDVDKTPNGILNGTASGNIAHNAEIKFTANGTAKEGALSGANGTSTQPKRSLANGSTINTNLNSVNRKHSSYYSNKNKSHNILESPDHSGDKPATRKDVEFVFDQFAQLIHTSRRPLPHQGGDGTYHENDEQTGFWADLKHMRLKDIDTIKHLLEDRASGKPQEDREMHMEAIVQLLAELPDRSKNRLEMTSAFLDELWNTLPHPPLSYLGHDFKYRSADGSNNSYIFPKLGAANTPYARTVNPVTVQPGALPDPGLIFDSILAREEFKPHPNKISSIFFNWASIVIHDLFQTSHEDPAISLTSSYLDLSVLYGDTQENQNQMRTFKDGKIKPDCFAEERLLAFPPSCGTMLILLNRFHNYIVETLASINENGRFNKPPSRLTGKQLDDAWTKYDEDLFQTGRLITCGLYINVILFDYLRTILNLNRTNSTWSLDPRLDKPKAHGGNKTPQAVGNQVSAEFAVSYRWHSCIGEMDQKWTEIMYQQLFGKDAEDLDIRELMVGLGKFNTELSKDPFERPFAGLQRGPDGKFDDGDLASIMINGIEQVSGAFDARNIPKSMRAITILGIQQGRNWQLCTLNEFRKFFGLKTYDSFDEINPDPYVAEQLQNLYEHPDHVELFPGIASEAAKEPMVPGVGICPSYTLSRTILSDAVALVRGDRFYTLDYNPKNLTNWGYNEVQYDLGVNHGCVFYKLLLRALPNHFKPDSIYAHYPMTIPSENAAIMKSLGRYQDYDWDKPEYFSPGIVLTSYKNIRFTLERDQDFKLMSGDGSSFVMGNYGESFSPREYGTFHHGRSANMSHLLHHDRRHSAVKEFYSSETLSLIRNNSVKIAGINQVDITRDVFNLTNVRFASSIFSIPLRTKEDHDGIFTDSELFMALSVIYAAMFFDLEPAKSFPLRIAAQKLFSMLGKMIELQVKGASNTSLASKLMHSFHNHESEENIDNPLRSYGKEVIRSMSESGISQHEIAMSQILPTTVAMVSSQSQAFTQILDYYLGDGVVHLPDIQRFAREDTSYADDKLLHYAMEGIRLNGNLGTYRRAETEHTFIDHDHQLHVKPGDRIFCSFADAVQDETIFSDAREVKLDRPLDSYIHYNAGDHTCLGKDVSMIALTAMLRTIGRMEGLRRAPGPQGQLKKVLQPHGLHEYMRADYCSHFAIPMTLKVHFDRLV